jgi:hypothetical protein
MAKARTSSKRQSTRVRSRSGKTYRVDDRDGASIRTEKLWRLGTLEYGTTFHAVHRHRKKNWVWGYATSGPGGEPKLTYKKYRRCGWVMLSSLKPAPQRDYKKPPVRYDTWLREVYRSIEFLWVNYGTFSSGVKRKNSPVPTRRRDPKAEIVGWKNKGGGDHRVLEGPIGIRYLAKDGWYMAWARNFRWCFVHESMLRPPNLTKARAVKYTAAQARAR